jgi:uncharacterized protein YoxC
MKKSILFTFLFALAFFTGQAQMESYTKDVSMSLGTLPALVVDLNEIPSKVATDYWTAYLKEYGKLKKNRKADELFAEDIRIPLITPTEIDLFSKVEDLQNDSRIYLWIDQGSAFLSSDQDPAVFKNAKKFVDDFAVYAEKKHVEELLDSAEKDLKGLEKDLKGLGKDKESYEKNIEKAKETIAKMERNIEENIVSQESKVTEIEDQKNMLIKIQERLASIGKVKTKM